MSLEFSLLSQDIQEYEIHANTTSILPSASKRIAASGKLYFTYVSKFAIIPVFS